MKKFILGIFFIISNFIFATKDDVLGYWITEKGDSGNQVIVEIYKTKEDKFNGIIRDLTIPKYLDGEYAGKDKMDLKNKDENLRGRKLVGIDFVYSFTYDEKENKYKNGNIYNPENGKVYHSFMQLNSDGTLTVKGSLDKAGLIGKKQIWQRYNK